MRMVTKRSFLKFETGLFEGFVERVCDESLAGSSAVVPADDIPGSHLGLAFNISDALKILGYSRPSPSGFKIIDTILVFSVSVMVDPPQRTMLALFIVKLFTGNVFGGQFLDGFFHNIILLYEKSANLDLNQKNFAPNEACYRYIIHCL